MADAFPSTSQGTYPSYYYDWINEDWPLSRLAPRAFEILLPNLYRFIQITNEEDFGHD
jgi:hypothetical protein